MVKLINFFIGSPAVFGNMKNRVWQLKYRGVLLVGRTPLTMARIDYIRYLSEVECEVEEIVSRFRPDPSEKLLQRKDRVAPTPKWVLLKGEINP